jgi:hypothetical protein
MKLFIMQLQVRTIEIETRYKSTLMLGLKSVTIDSKCECCVEA